MDATNNRKEIGKKIREIRIIKGFTQEELGEKASLSYKFVGELERGRVNVSLDSLDRIANALDVNIEDLFRKRKEPVLKITVKEKSLFSRFSSQDLLLIKKALRLLNRVFSRI